MVIPWFLRWLKQHKANNPHNGWAAFEQPGRARVYLGWIKAFSELGVTEAEADAASLKLQRQGEAWPVDHLARLLAILRPMVASRKAEEEIARRRRTSADWAELQDLRREAREAFRRLPAEEGYGRLASIRARYPALADLPRAVEWLAVDEWRGVQLPDPAGHEPPPSVGESAASAPIVEPAPTPGQAAFLDALEDRQREALAACSPARRREILAPFADGFDPALVPVLAAEIRSIFIPVAEAAYEPAAAGSESWEDYE